MKCRIPTRYHSTHRFTRTFLLIVKIVTCNDLLQHLSYAMVRNLCDQKARLYYPHYVTNRTRKSNSISIGSFSLNDQFLLKNRLQFPKPATALRYKINHNTIPHSFDGPIEFKRLQNSIPFLLLLLQNQPTKEHEN